MILIFTVIAFSFLMVSISIFGYRRYVRPSRIVSRQLGGTMTGTYEESVAEAGFGETTLPVRIFQQIGEQFPVSPQDVSVQRRYLIAAGYRSETAVQGFYGIKIVAMIVFFTLAFTVVWSYLPSILILRIVCCIGAALAGFFGPNLVLERMVSRRQERIRLALPDALDLMVVCVEAGLGLDQAILNVSRELEMAHPDLSQEFSLMNLEIRGGKRRADALRNLAARTGESELRKLVALLIQTDRFGTSMADALRTHSDFMRIRRRQQAEERAGKVGVKLVFPIFFFILPAMFVVAAGPGVLQVIKQLLPMMKSLAAG